jgi:hypothetical protein
MWKSGIAGRRRRSCIFYTSWAWEAYNLANFSFSREISSQAFAVLRCSLARLELCSTHTCMKTLLTSFWTRSRHEEMNYQQQKQVHDHKQFMRLLPTRWHYMRHRGLDSSSSVFNGATSNGSSRYEFLKYYSNTVWSCRSTHQLFGFLLSFS